MRTCHIIIGAWLCLATIPDNVKAELTNGDFASGDLTGWTDWAIGSSLDPIASDPFIDVTAFGSGNAVTFETGAFADDLFLASLEQEIVISAIKSTLVFDFSLPTVTADATGVGDSLVPDALFVLLDNGTELLDLLLIDSLGPVVDPFASAPGEVKLGAPSDDAFEFSLQADLSAIVGQSVVLAFELVQEDDGAQISKLAVSNVHLIPEPSTTLLAAALVATLALTPRAAPRFNFYMG